MNITIKQYEQAADAKVSIGGIKWQQKFDVCIQCDSRQEAEAIQTQLNRDWYADAYGYAKRLAEAIYQTHYKQNLTEWKPLDTTLGVLTQIDNMISGLVKKPSQQKPVVWMYQDKSTNEVRFQKHMRDFVDHGQTYETPLYANEWVEEPLDKIMPIPQPEPEPVAWTVGGLITDFSRDFSAYKTKTYTRPLYTAPPQREWQGLTDEEYEAMAEQYVTNYYFDTLKYARAVEAKLKEKNS